jgi:hypothetical protein
MKAIDLTLRATTKAPPQVATEVPTKWSPVFALTFWSAASALVWTLVIAGLVKLL